MSDVQPIDLDDLQRVGVKVRELTDDNWLADMVEIARDEIARLREERRSITTLLGKVETLEADNAKLREERRCVWSDYDGSRDFETACGNRQSIDLDLEIYDFCPFCGCRVEEQNDEPPEGAE